MLVPGLPPATRCGSLVGFPLPFIAGLTFCTTCAHTHPWFGLPPHPHRCLHSPHPFWNPAAAHIAVIYLVHLGCLNALPRYAHPTTPATFVTFAPICNIYYYLLLPIPFKRCSPDGRTTHMPTRLCGLAAHYWVAFYPPAVVTRPLFVALPPFTTRYPPRYHCRLRVTFVWANFRTRRLRPRYTPHYAHTHTRARTTHAPPLPYTPHHTHTPAHNPHATLHATLLRARCVRSSLPPRSRDILPFTTRVAPLRERHTYALALLY